MGKQDLNPETIKERAARQQREQDAKFETGIISNLCENDENCLWIKVKGKAKLIHCTKCGREAVRRY